MDRHSSLRCLDDMSPFSRNDLHEEIEIRMMHNVRVVCYRFGFTFLVRSPHLQLGLVHDEHVFGPQTVHKIAQLLVEDVAGLLGECVLASGGGRAGFAHCDLLVAAEKARKLLIEKRRAMLFCGYPEGVGCEFLQLLLRHARAGLLGGQNVLDYDLLLFFSQNCGAPQFDSTEIFLLYLLAQSAQSHTEASIYIISNAQCSLVLAIVRSRVDPCAFGDGSIVPTGSPNFMIAHA